MPRAILADPVTLRQAIQNLLQNAARYARTNGSADVTVGCFQEQLVGGYPPEDLVQWRGFVDAQREGLMRFAEAMKAEDERHIREGLTEDELELFDLLKGCQGH